jgi:alkylated DNA nucleotide flippase Atl1
MPLGLKLKDKVIEIVNRIPLGKVCYYGQIAQVLALEFEVHVTAQMVGWVLSGMKQSEYHVCPWERVVAKDGYLATLKLGPKGMLQKELLLKDGYNVSSEDYVNMGKHCIAFEELCHMKSEEESGQEILL